MPVIAVLTGVVVVVRAVLAAVPAGAAATVNEIGDACEPPTDQVSTHVPIELEPNVPLSEKFPFASVEP